MLLDEGFVRGHGRCTLTDHVADIGEIGLDGPGVEQARKRVGGNGNGRSGGTFIFIGHYGGGSSSMSGGRSPAMASVSKGGFGSIGGRVGGGFGG